MGAKFKVGQKIKTKKDEVEGHVVMIFNPFLAKERVYYCSMYPGAQPDYEYVNVVDLCCSGIDNKGRVETLQALNKYKEKELILNKEI